MHAPRAYGPAQHVEDWRGVNRLAIGRIARAVSIGAVISLSGISLSSCAANPGPPPLVDSPEDQTVTTTMTQTTTRVARPEQLAPAQSRAHVHVGTDPVRNGFNPHLQADEQATVQTIADLVLPSAFVDGERNPDLLVAATPLPASPAAQTVRYIIAPEAQWSDGTPISGADFAYLWRGMRSTPGAVDSAGYDAIVDVRVSGNSGKVVDVDFGTPVREWSELFTHLLPSHLFDADASDFASALAETVPASAGRFMVVRVDRARNTVTLNRNDRFWGPEPARIDILTLQGLRTTTQVADQLRSRQLAFVDRVPDETTRRVISLVPETQVRTLAGPRTLGITVSTNVPPAARRELSQLVDAPLLAPIATGRSTDLELPETPAPTGRLAAPNAPESAAAEGQAATSTLLPNTAETETTGAVDTVDTAAPVETSAGLATFLAARGVLRVAADASDPAAGAAARSLVDILNREQVPAEVVSTDTASIMSKGLPSGEIDLVVHWRLDDETTTSVAGRAACSPHAFRAANISGYCNAETEALASAVLEGTVSAAEGARVLAQVEAEEALWIPIVKETRLLALGTGIVGPDEDLMRWTEGLASAPRWRIADNEAAMSSTPTVGREAPQ